MIKATIKETAEIVSRAISRYAQSPNPYSVSTEFVFRGSSYDFENGEIVFMYEFAPQFNLTDNRMSFTETRTTSGKLIRVKLHDDTSEKIYHAPNPVKTVIDVQ